MIRVEVAYALPEVQVLINVKLAPGATALDAVQDSGILQRFPEINHSRITLGIFGEIVAHDQPLNTGDRVEIYRPLKIDPKEVRRRKALQQKKPRRARKL